MLVHILASGSDGNCTVIEADDEAIMIDAGISYKRIAEKAKVNKLDLGKVKAILITHEHGDHVSGVGPTARKLGIPVVANRATFDASNVGEVQHWVYESNSDIDIGKFHVTPLPTSHDAVEPNAYYVEYEGRRVLVATDTGKLSFQIKEALGLADVAVIEANYDQEMLRTGPYSPSLKAHVGSDEGHMCNVDTALAIKSTMGINKKRVIFLAHLSKNNNTPDIARQTVSDITGIPRFLIDSLETPGETRIIKVPE